MEQLKWETKKVKVKDLIQLDINPRKISEDKKQKLVESLEKFNLVEIPAVNTDLQIIGGNQRVTALLLVGRGEEEIDVRFPNRKLTKKEVKEYAIISNTHAGEFDFEILDLEFADISIGELGFEIEGWDDWKNKQDTLLAGEAQEDDFDVPVGGSETDIVLGDLFEIGEHRLLCGDSTDSDQVAKLMNGDKADMVFTDPPYGISYKSNWKSKDREQFDEIKNDDVILDILPSLILLSKNNIHWYIWTSHQVYNIWRENFKEYYKSTIIWSKKSGAMGDLTGDYVVNYEMALFCHYGRKELNGHRESAIWELTRDSGIDYLHPTQKPISLSEKGIINSSKEKDIISDLFLGSGSTMVASHQLKRKCYGMELDSKYAEVIVRRMIKLDNTLTIKRNGIDETQKWLDKLA